jgi:hypothetical protein
MRHWNRTRWSLLALALAAGTPGLAHANDADGCFTPVGGIDGVNPKIDILGNGENDARWNGAYGYGWETGALAEAEFKTIIGTNPSNAQQKMLYLSWRRKMTTNQISGAEGVQVGFGYTPAGATDQLGQIVQITFGLAGDIISTPTPKNADGTITGVAPANVSLLYKQGVNTAKSWKATQAQLQWVYDNTRTFVLQDAGGKLYWIVQMSIPIKSSPEADPTPPSSGSWTTPGVYLDPSTLTTTAGAPSIPYWADMIQALDPQANTIVYRSFPDPGLSDPSTPNYNKQQRDVTPSGQIGTPAPAHWSGMQPGSPRDGTCKGTGLTFTNFSNDIANLSAASYDGNLNMFNDVGGVISRATNQMQVTVHNTSTQNTSINVADISALFSIAPYGSQTGARSAAWAPLYDNGNAITCTGTPPNQHCSTVVGTQLSAITSAAGTISTTTPFSLTMPAAASWSPVPSYFCAVVDQNGKPVWQYPDFATSHYCQNQGAPWTPAAQSTSTPTTMWDGLPWHQCMQVELTSNGASGGVYYANKSAFRNMVAGQASQYKEQAIIDTRGLPTGKTKVNGKGGHYIYLYAEQRNMPYATVDTGPVIYSNYNATYAQAAYEGQPGYEDLAGFLPTLAVHTFWDTGKTSKIAGKSIKVLEPMTSYGNFLTHDYANEGTIYGWDVKLDGAEQVGPSTWRIFVPNEGRVSVGTNIVARPAPRCGGTVKGCGIEDLVESLEQAIGSSLPDQSRLGVLTQAQQIQCSDLYDVLNDIAAKDWGCWNSWVTLLIGQIKTASGCSC